MAVRLLIPYHMIKKQIPGSSVSVDVSRRTRKSKFFHQINAGINWTVFEKERQQVCKRSVQDAAGRPAYHPLALSKMMLLQTRYHLSDMGVEDMVNDTLWANAFCGLRAEDTTPDHSTRSRFRSELSDGSLTDSAKLYNELLGRGRHKIERVFGSIKRWLGGL